MQNQLRPSSFTLKSQPVRPELKPQDDTPEGWYDLWKQNPTPQSGARLFQSVDGSLRQAARKWAGDDSPVVMGQAKSLLIDALPRYDSSKAGLSTFIDRQLQPLTRWKARKNIGVKVPTGHVQQIRILEELDNDMEDELGRAPSVQELADRSGIPLSQIAKLNRQKYPVLGEKVSQDGDGGQNFVEDQAIKGNEDLWVKTVYHSLPEIDQVILQHTLGLYGVRKLSNQAIAKKLRLSPGAISQRKARIQRFLDEPPTEMQ